MNKARYIALESGVTLEDAPKAPCPPYVRNVKISLVLFIISLESTLLCLYF